MVKRNLFVGGIMISLVLLTNCENIRCIKGNDNLVSENIENVETFNTIVLEAGYDVTVTQDSITTLSILADDNLIPYITTEVVGGELILTTANDRCLRSQNDIRVLVSTPNIIKVISEGSGDIYISDLTLNDTVSDNSLKVYLDGSGNINLGDVFCDDLYVDLIGSGEVYFSDINTIDIELYNGGSGDIFFLGGIANKGKYIVDGSGDIIADRVDINQGVTNIYASGDIYVWAREILSGEITGSGNVYYRALPLEGPFIEENGTGQALPLTN